MAFVKYQLTAPQVEDANGDPLVGGSITAYLWDTSTPTPMYTNSAGDGADTSFTLNTLGNPQTDAGTAIDIFLDTAITYKFIIRDSEGAQVGPTIGPVYPAGGSGQTAEFASLEEFRASSFSGSETVILAANAGTTTGRMILKATGTSAGTPTLTAARFTALAAGEIINAGGYGYSLAQGQAKTPWMFGATGGADDYVALQLWAGVGGDLSIDADFNSSQTLTLSVARTTIAGNRHKITFADAAGTGINVNAQGCWVHGLYAWGDDTSTPSINMIRANGSNGAYLTVQSCNIAYANIGIEAANGNYITKSINNVFSNCYYYEHLTNATDFQTSGCTFGTSTFLTAAIFGASTCAGHVISANYFETESRSWSVQVGSNCAFWNMTGNIFNGSGGILGEAPVVINSNQWNGGRPDTTYNAIIRLANNASESTIVGNKMTAYYTKGASPSAGTAISATVSHCTIGLNQIRYFDYGLVTTGTHHSIGSNKVSYCGYGMQFNSPSDYCMLTGNNVTDSDTRDYDVQSGTHTVIGPDNYGLIQGLSKRIGTTANRPTLDSEQAGYQYLDTTLDADGKPIWWNGSAWVDATGATV